MLPLEEMANVLLFILCLFRNGRVASFLAENDAVQGEAPRPGEEEQDGDAEVNDGRFVRASTGLGHERVMQHEGVHPDRHRHRAGQTERCQRREQAQHPEQTAPELRNRRQRLEDSRNTRVRAHPAERVLDFPIAMEYERQSHHEPENEQAGGNASAEARWLEQLDRFHRLISFGSGVKSATLPTKAIAMIVFELADKVELENVFGPHASNRASIVIFVLSRREMGHPAFAEFAAASNLARSPPGMRAFTSR